MTIYFQTMTIFKVFNILKNGNDFLAFQSRWLVREAARVRTPGILQWMFTNFMMNGVVVDVKDHISKVMVSMDYFSSERPFE